MYTIRTEVMVVPGKTRAFEAWWAQLSGLAKAQHGFQAGTLLNALSGASKKFLYIWIIPSKFGDRTPCGIYPRI
jgi:hypothetical protein